MGLHQKGMTMKRTAHPILFLLGLGLWIPSVTLAQQEAMYTHYMLNTLAVNPAYAGSRDALTGTLLHRSQWVSFPGAPVTQTLTIHGPAFSEKLGLGLSFVNDKHGPLSNTSVFVDAAYIMYLNKEDRLAFGVKGGISLFRGAFSDINTTVAGDNVFGADIGATAKPNFGAGIYYYKPRMYIGLSSPALLNNKYSVGANGESIVTYEQAQHVFLIAGTVFEVARDMELKPTSLMKVTAGAPIEMDVTAMAIYREKVQFGLMYRTGDAAGILAGFNINEQLYAGYSFDWSFTNATGRYNQGSHELALRYDFVYKHRRKIKSPRYF
jgi:type IX secretion system PorP/SprF family membrane protein